MKSSTHAIGRANPAFLSASRCSMAAIPVLAVLHGAFHLHWALWAASAAAIWFVAAERGSITTTILRVCGVLFVATAMAAPFAKQPLASLERGLQIGVLIGSLVLTTNLLARAAVRSAAIKRLLTRILASAASGQQLRLGVASHASGAMLGLAGIAMMMDLASCETGQTTKQRSATFVTMTRGYAAASLWSPMFSNISVATALYPGVSAWTVLPLGLLIGMVVTLLGAALLPRIKAAHDTPASDPSPQAMGMLQAAPAIIAMAAYLALTIALSWAAGIPISAAILVLAPVAAWLVGAGLAPRGNRFACASKAWLQDFQGLHVHAGDVLLFLVSGCAGAIIADAIAGGWVLAVGQLVATRPVIACLLVMVGTIVLSCAAIHPILSAVLVATCLPPQVVGLPPFAHLAAVLVGWSMGVTLTPFSVVSVMASRLSGIALLGISLRANLAFVTTSVLGAALLLGHLAALGAR
jgi:hypothetical protein